MPPAPAKPEREFCPNCGFPTRGARCDACGAAREARPRDASDDTPTKRGQARPYALDPEVDTSRLDAAIDAFHAKDLPRFVELLIAAEGGATARTVPTPDGTGWIAVVRSALLFVTLRAAADELVVEAPIARLPARSRLPALRLALELGACEAAGSRVSLRGDLLLIRFTARLSLLTPAVLCHHLREIGHLASRYAGLMMMGEGALPPFSDEQRAAPGFDALGRARKIQLGTGGNIRRSIPPPPPPPQIPPQHERSQPGDARPRRPESIVPARPLKREEDPPTPPPMDASEGMPAILAPMFAAPAPADDRKRPPSSPRAPIPDDRRRPQTGPIEGAGRLAAPTPPPSSDPPMRRAPSMVGLSAVGVSRPGGEFELDTPARRASQAPSWSEAGLSPADRLCMLLRQAQSLASLTLEERPASMPWLVRATVFRCIYEYKETLPDSVAHLFRSTGTLMSPGGSGRASQNPVAPSEPALLIMERVIVARGQMPKEKPLIVEPMTSAAQAKEHVARYLLEIDRAPADPSLRHFLGLGALSELLARTKLPPQTDQRLRDIVAHAQREGAKSQAIDLMMTALQRITA